MADKEEPTAVSPVSTVSPDAAPTGDAKKWLLTSTQASLIGPFVDYMGLGSIFPLLPYFILEKGAGTIWLGVIISVQYAALTFGSQFFGWLCDHRDPKVVMMVVLAFDVVFFYLSGVAPTVGWMIVFRLICGFCTPMPVGSAWIGITVPDEEKPKAFYKSTLAILSGFISGTALGGLTGKLEHACTAAAAIALVALLLVAFGAPPLPRDARKGADGETVVPKGAGRVARRFEWRSCALISYNCGQEGSTAGPIASMLFASEMGYSEQQTGWVFCGLVSALLVANLFLMDPLIRKFPNPLRRVLTLAACETPAYIGMIVLFSFKPLPAHADKIFIALCILIFVFNCMLHPTSFDLGSSYADKWGQNCQGTVLGFQNSLFSFGQAVGPLVGAALLDVDYVWCFVFMYSGLAAVLVANGVVYLRSTKNEEDGDGVGVAAAGEPAGEGETGNVQVQSAAVVVPLEKETAAQV